jgi:very-short-patch-repair endonuclease
MLWQALRQRPGGYKFRKQHPLHPFSLDFACLATRLAIEVDGDAHDRAGRPERDATRDKRIEEAGFAVMHIRAAEVFNNLEGVVLGIVSECRRLGPLHHASHGPPPRAGEDL